MSLAPNSVLRVFSDLQGGSASHIHSKKCSHPPHERVIQMDHSKLFLKRKVNLRPHEPTTHIYSFQKLGS